jgi:GH15 family glucan-1,4-alpha-glucosidase
MLSDLRTAALVESSGRITWCCLPRIDSPPIFAELLGGPRAGRFSVTPLHADGPARQRYLGDSLILETAWDRVRVTDFLDCSGGRPNQRAGRAELVRIIEGEGAVEIVFAPRLDFGRSITRLSARDGGVVVEDTHDPIVLHAPGVRWTIVDEGRHQTARATVELNGEPLVLEMRYGMGSLRPTPNHGRRRLELTEKYWATWAERLETPDRAPDLVRRSAAVLKGLVYGPTGAISAAATTSLPEHIGGVRNWDYRYCWLRDAAMSASALVKLGSVGEAMAYLDWVLGVVSHSDSPELLMPLYAVTGEALGPEAEIGDLPGYRGSRPVRVGNAAARQVQIDVFGPIVELVRDLMHRDAALSSEHWRLVEQMVGAVERRWREPDHGIWEIRKPMRHHVHSKVMCWVTVDRGLEISRAFLDRDQPRWADLGNEIRADLLEHGWKDDPGAFTAAYDGADLDAAALTVGLTGLLEPGDERFDRTVRAVEAELRSGPTVYRYRCDDGLPGFEGGFHLCAGWLVEAYLRTGRRRDAEELFDAYTALAGPTGLLSEQFGPQSGRSLGNHPQAYSHLMLIENALSLSRAED